MGRPGGPRFDFGGFRARIWYFGLNLMVWALFYLVLESFRFLEFNFRGISGSFCIQCSYFSHHWVSVAGRRLIASTLGL